MSEEQLFRSWVREAAQAFSRLPVNSAKKKHAFAEGLGVYAPGAKNIAIAIEDGQITYVSVDHPRLGFVEVSVPALLPAA